MLFRNIYKNKLTKSTFIYTISRFFNSATAFLLLPVLTRYLSTEEYGMVSMFNATVGFFTPFVCMGATAAIGRKIVDKANDEAEYVFNCLLVTIYACIILSIIIFTNRNLISEITNIPDTYFIDILILTFSTVIVDIALITLQMHDKTNNYAVIQNLGTILNIISSIILVIGLGMGISGRIYAMTFSKLLFAFIGFFIIKNEVGIKIHFNITYIKDDAFNFGLPLIPTYIKGTVLTYTDKLFITNLVSVSETGIYSVGNQFALPILIFAQAFNLAYVPWLFDKLKTDNYNQKKKIVMFTYVYFLIIIISAIGWSFVSFPIIKYIIGIEYQDASKYTFWLSLSYAFTGMHMMVVNYIYFYKKLHLYSLITIVVLLSNVVFNYMFINSFGTVGAAQATMLVCLISFLLTWLLAMCICDMPWFGKKYNKD